MWTYTLEEWQKKEKSQNEILYNCSEFDRQEDGWISFTIGMGYQFANHTGALNSFSSGSHDQLVLCAVSPWTDRTRRGLETICRDRILETLSKNGIHNQTLNPSDYFQNLSKYKFVISPEGNGIDCHRHYEALMAGCIPIIEEHAGIREKYKGCPVVYTKDYSEITPEYLESLYTPLLHQTWDFSKLIFSTYDESVQKEICANGNYWCQQLLKRQWYS
jgi:hypothetical protein